MGVLTADVVPRGIYVRDQLVTHSHSMMTRILKVFFQLKNSCCSILHLHKARRKEGIEKCSKHNKTNTALLLSKVLINFVRGCFPVIPESEA